MSDTKPCPGDGGNEVANRSLPPWMNSEKNSSHRKKTAGCGREAVANPKQAGGEHDVYTVEAETAEGSASPCSNNSKLSNLMEGVVFTLSGFVNPERAALRSQALGMGAEYKPDWTSDCSLLVCAFPNTPKLRQVKAENGTVVGKEWISECHLHRKLVDIEPYLMHAGKPWRKAAQSRGQDEETTGGDSQRKKGSRSELSSGILPSKNVDSNLDEDALIPPTLKKWAHEDLSRTVTWLESQEEKPEADELKKIAAEGILTCLQDAVDALEQNQDVRQISEQWKFVPHVVDELIKLNWSGNNAKSLSRKDLCKKAMEFKQIYASEYRLLEDNISSKHKKQRRNNGATGTSYDSDDTVEMTEEEIEEAYNTVTLTVPELYQCKERGKGIVWLGNPQL